MPVIASGGAGGAEHVADALEVAQAALLASILHEDPDRLASLRAELRELGVPRAMELRPAIVQDVGERPRADARLDGRGGRAAHAARPARHGSGAARGSELWRKGETSGNTLAVDELRDDCDGDALLLRVRPRARRVTPARSAASRRRSGARSASGRSSGRRGRTRRSCSTAASAASPARSARRRSSSRSPRSTRPTSASSRRRPTSSTTSTCCSPHAASTSRRSRTSSRAGPGRCQTPKGV